jgi:hypothetical protein
MLYFFFDCIESFAWHGHFTPKIGIKVGFRFERVSTLQKESPAAVLCGCGRRTTENVLQSTAWEPYMPKRASGDTPAKLGMLEQHVSS